MKKDQKAPNQEDLTSKKDSAINKKANESDGREQHKPRDKA